jgi:hypothetical protein
VDDHDWYDFASWPDPLIKTPEYVTEHRLRDTGTIEGRMSFQVIDKAGKPLLGSDKLLKSYTWSGAGRLKDGLHIFELYDSENRAAGAVRGDNLVLRLSYSGDSTLTNRGHLVLKLWPD